MILGNFIRAKSLVMRERMAFLWILVRGLEIFSFSLGGGDFWTSMCIECTVVTFQRNTHELNKGQCQF